MALSKLVSRAVAQVGGVHRSARTDALVTSRHESFVATHLVGGLLALACLAVYAASAAKADFVTVVALAWLTVPALLSAMVVLTGRIDAAHVLSAAHHATLVGVTAAFTGGVGSFVLPWIVIVPVEAALSGRRRVIAIAFALAAVSLLALVVAEVLGYLPEARPVGLPEPALRLVGLVSAGLYAGLLALTIHALAHRTERAVREGERRYRLMAENATDLISVHDVGGCAHFVSPGAWRLFGHEPSELLGTGFLEAVSVAERPAFLAALADAGHRGSETAVSYRFGRPGCATPVWVETRCRPLGREGDDGGARVIAVTRDISEARAREDELRRTRDEAESASRAKSRFLANVSHELRTPLNAIIGFSEVLADGLDADGRWRREREFVGLIAESGNHLLKVVNDLLDMSRIEAGRYRLSPTPIMLADVFRVCADMMGPAAREAGVLIVHDAGEAPPPLVADERALRQIILNLLSNAVKFSDAGGTVRLSARAESEMVEISVTDEGIGIAAGDIARLGEPFVQAEGDYDRKYEGAGLGLSVVKGLVRLHGGALAIESEPGRGTRVTIRLPMGMATEEATPTEDEAPASPRAAARG